MNRKFCTGTTQQKLDLFEAILHQENQSRHTIINFLMYQFIMDHLEKLEYSQNITEIFSDDIETANL